MQNYTEYKVNDVFSLEATFNCGQCFRWEKCGDEAFRGVALGRELRVSLKGKTLTADCKPEEFSSVWLPYFDLERDYAEIRRLISTDKVTARAAEYGAGIRILRQEPWEALCSFIISQCNNIPRIRGIILKLCREYGDKVGDGAYSFPEPERLAAEDSARLAALIRCGYRAPYIISAAKAVVNGELDLAHLSALPTPQARDALIKLPGIGKKVANCVLLFGFHKLDAFPVDVWVRRALNSLYDESFNPDAAFGPYSGIAQQYIFYLARSERIMP